MALTLKTKTLPSGWARVLSATARRLDLSCREVHRNRLLELATASWPHLTHLAFRCPELAIEPGPTPFAALSDSAPRLIDLRVHEHPRAGALTHAVLDDVLASPLLARLQTLDLNPLGLDVNVLRPHWPKLRHLALLPSAETQTDDYTRLMLAYLFEEPYTTRALAILQGIDTSTGRFGHDVHIRVGICLALLSRFDEALVALEDAIVLDPTCGRAWSHRAAVLKRLGRLAEASEALDHTDDTNHPASENLVALLRASIAVAQGQPVPDDLDDTRASLAAALAEKDYDADVHYEHACALAMLGRFDEAIGALAAAIAICPPLRAWLPGEIDFAPMRDLPRFRALL